MSKIPILLLFYGTYLRTGSDQSHYFIFKTKPEIQNIILIKLKSKKLYSRKFYFIIMCNTFSINL